MKPQGCRCWPGVPASPFSSAGKSRKKVGRAAPAAPLMGTGDDEMARAKKSVKEGKDALGICQTCGTAVSSATARECVLCASRALLLKVRRHAQGDMVSIWLLEQGKADQQWESSLLYGDMTAERADNLIARMKKLGLAVEEETSPVPFVPLDKVNSSEQLEMFR